MKNVFEGVKTKCLRRLEKFLFQYYYDKLISKGRSTSLSDNNEYPVICYMASKNEKFFKNFRRNSIYNGILEHVSQEQGQEYLDVINQNDKIKFSNTNWDDFLKNDLYGNPRMFSYEINGRVLECAPTTLRYVKVLQDIMLWFDADKIKRIAEIGIGYGGECRILTDFLGQVEQYALFDLPEVLGLAKKYLGKFGGDNISKVQFVNGTDINISEEYDFVMSNYAFSELVRGVQDIYLEKVILKSKAGYITWNSLSYDVLDGYSLEELLSKIQGSSVIAEVPLTSPNNCIIMWGQSNGHC